MQLIKANSTGHPVKILQHFLKSQGFADLEITGSFDVHTDEAVKAFQALHQLEADGKVGRHTWTKLFRKAYNFSLNATTLPLKNGQYAEGYHSKKSIYLHHTAGGGSPKGVINWWNNDRQGRIATAFIIGRTEENDDDKYNGVLYRCFPEYQWAHHLGIKKNHIGSHQEKNLVINQQSIGIEICARGPLKKSADGTFYQKLDGATVEVPEDQVCILGRPWRGEQYFHKYTDEQLATCKELILNLAYLFHIPLRDSPYSRDWFDLKYEAFQNEPGLWTHCNVRYDKTDCFPQPELIDMLNSLHEASQTHQPSASALAAIPTARSVSGNVLESLPVIENYTPDMDDIEDEMEVE